MSFNYRLPTLDSNKQQTIPTKEFEDLVKKVNDIYDFLKVGGKDSISEINGFVTEEDAIKIVKKSKNWLWRKRKDGHILLKN